MSTRDDFVVWILDNRPDLCQRCQWDPAVKSISVMKKVLDEFAAESTTTAPTGNDRLGFYVVMADFFGGIIPTYARGAVITPEEIKGLKIAMSNGECDRSSSEEHSQEENWRLRDRVRLWMLDKDRLMQNGTSASTRLATEFITGFPELRKEIRAVREHIKYLMQDAAPMFRRGGLITEEEIKTMRAAVLEVMGSDQCMKGGCSSS